MIWMSSTMDENKQKRKWLIVKHKTVKWAKANDAPPQRITLTNFHGKWDDSDIAFMITMIIKQGKLKCI
jgi:hypothetical protein